MSELQAMIFVTVIVAAVFAVGPVLAALVAWSPLGRIANLRHHIRGYEDGVIWGLVILCVLAFIAGWVYVTVGLLGPQ